MIRSFESRLAAVLGGRLDPPFQGRAFVAPGPEGDDGPRILIAVEQVERREPAFGSDTRLERTPPTRTAARRVGRLRLAVALEVLPGPGDGRAQQLAGFESALYALGAADLTTGRALENGVDQGFTIQRLEHLRSGLPVRGADAGRVSMTLEADGMFWPAGVAGETGEPIAELRLRAGQLPVRLIPPQPLLVAGGAAVTLTLEILVAGETLLTAGAAPQAAAFGPLAVSLRSPEGGPANGSLGGGTPGAGDVRLIPLTDGRGEVTYTPPAEATVDHLVVAMTDGEDGAGLALGRFAVTVRGG